jgi:multisubunit Na+/H+ antiporter MnhC subunit
MKLIRGVLIVFIVILVLPVTGSAYPPFSTNAAETVSAHLKQRQSFPVTLRKETFADVVALIPTAATDPVTWAVVLAFVVGSLAAFKLLPRLARRLWRKYHLLHHVHHHHNHAPARA